MSKFRPESGDDFWVAGVGGAGPIYSHHKSG